MVPCLLWACAADLSSQGGAQSARAEFNTTAQLQMQTAIMRSEVDTLRAALLEKDRRESELWQGYMALMARVNQLIEQQQQAQLSANSAQNCAEITAANSTQTERPLAVKALLRAINRMNLNPEQKQSLIKLLSPPRAIDGINPWTGVATF